jgi:hypothetical protein
MPLTRAQARQLATVNGSLRCDLGCAFLIVPRLPLAPWVGDAGGTQLSGLLASSSRGRDVAIGVGALMACAGDVPVRG